MSSELPAPVVRALLLSVDLLGVDAGALLSKVPRAKHASVWEELLLVLETFSTLEGPARTQRLVEEYASRSAVVAAATEFLGDARHTFQLLLELASRQPFVEVSARTAGNGLRVHLELQRGHRPSLLLFQSFVWFLSAIPRARGLNDARVKVERLTERELRCVVTMPAERGFRLPLGDAHVKSLSQRVFPQETALAASRRTVPSSQAIEQRFGLTRGEARVVRRLAEGSSIKRIAEELHVSPETARTHAKRAMQKTDTHRQAELVSLVLQGED